MSMCAKYDQDETSASSARIGVTLLLTLALLTGIAPFAIDLYLPAFPEMVKDLATTSAGVQLSLTTFLIGAGVGQLIFGPLSDRLGRRSPLVMGMGLYLVASVAVALAPTITVFVSGRFVQGLAGAAGMVISRAIIIDRARGAQAARYMSIVMMVSGIAPVIALVVGSMLVNPLGWRGLMWILTGLVGIGFVAVLLFVRETRPRALCDPGHRAAPASTARALMSRAYLGNMFAYVFAFATMMAYISASPFLYQSMMGLNEIGYGLMFGLNALTLTITGAVSARLTRRFRAAALARTGLLFNLAAIVVLALLVLAGVPSIWLAVPIFVAVGSLGLVFGSTIALALAAVPMAAGLASAILGMLQHLLAGAVAPLVGIAGADTAFPLVLTMFVASASANFAFAISTPTAHPRESIAVASEI
jgi:DHA1 family bicyclomycin/chloramphenicol resistance-like MFS transporter